MGFGFRVSLQSFPPAKKMAEKEELVYVEEEEEEEEEDDEGQDWGDWNADDEEEEGGDDSMSDLMLCLFCESKYSSSGELFEHCRSVHHFEFHAIRRTLGLDFYASFKLINYVRSQVAENRCWSCEFTCLSREDLQNHLHEASSSEVGTLPWSDDKHLRPFIQDDPLLYSFSENYEPEDEDTATVDKITDLVTSESIHIADDNRSKEIASTSSSCLSMINPLDEANNNGAIVKENGCLSDRKLKDEHLGVSFAKVVANEIKKVNKNYFGSYSSFGIHREMISDKVRTDAYRQALLNNPSLLHGAAVLDVGCGTGILSLFAAQAGASSVIAVEASDKMAAVATEIAKDNGFLRAGNPNNGTSRCTGVIRVVQGMVEELDKLECIQPQSVDVLLSEWMGYCLLYESMLTSVLLARDRWLKPGGAILPDTATIFVAGFGRGGTSIPFWEDVYGFNMSCIGKELVEEAARIPIVDVVDSHDIVTNSVVLQSFDLLRMTHDEMDFTSRIELEPLLDNSPTNSSPDATSRTTWCYGVVLWFETGFTSRFCKEMPIVLSTSPYTPRTHWSQTILTFREPIAMALGKPDADRSAAVGTAGCPASKILSRISIARASEHRSIDISLEIAGLTLDGRKHSWPAQIFNLS